MVVVMQLFAADDDADRQDVGRRIFAIVVAIAPVVTDAVDDAGRRHGNPCHLHCPDRQAEHTEQRDVDDQHQRHAQSRVLRVHIALEPVIRRTVAVFLDGLAVLRFGAVQFGAFEHHFLDAARDRAVRVFDGLALGVVLAVDRGPFLRDHAGRHPQPEAEEVAGDRMQVQRAMRLAAMQEDGNGRNRDVGDSEGEQQDFPAARMGHAVQQEIKYEIQTGILSHFFSIQSEDTDKR